MKMRLEFKFIVSGCAVLAMALLAGIPARAAEKEEEEKADFPNWSYDGAYQTHNGLRSSITLNGWWRWMYASAKGKVVSKGNEKGDYTKAPPSDESAWLYRKAPGFGGAFTIRKRDGSAAEKSDLGADVRDMAHTTAWVEREFTVPKEWKNRDVEVVFENTYGQSEIYLDGKLMGYAWGYRAHAVPIPKPYKDTPYRITVKTQGLTSGVWLRSFEPTGYRIADSYLTTSFRNMECTIRAAGQGKPDGKLTVVITEYNQPEKMVKKSDPMPVEADGDGWKIEASFSWKNPKLWTLVTPNLYSYYVEMADAKGKVVDRIFPIRFGFREIWIRGGDFMLNGNRVSLTMDLHSALGREPGKFPVGRYVNEEYTKKALQRWKDFGVYCCILRGAYNPDDSELFRVADEIGFFIALDTPSLMYSDPVFMNIPEIRQSARDHFTALILPRRHCPSLAFYHLANTHHYPPTYDYTPSMLGEDFDKAKFFGKDPIQEERSVIKAADPVRIAFAGSGGGKYEPVHSSMNYMSIDADLQVHETWPSQWAKTRKKPLAINEMEVPSFQKNWYKRTSRGQETDIPFIMETAAIHLGEQPYIKEPRENIATWCDPDPKARRVGLGGSWSWQTTCDIFVEPVFRAWRTYGVNLGFWCMFFRYYDEPRMSIPAVDLDPRRPDPVPDSSHMVWHWSVGPVTREGELAKKGLSPLLAFIGGPDGEFAYKDHCFYAGETIRKAVAVVNDSGLPTKLGGDWQLTDSGGKKIAGGTLKQIDFEPGELAPARLHIDFKAPDVKERTDYTLSFEGKANVKGHMSNSMAITVFPKEKPASPSKDVKLYLYDPVGDTKKMLDAAGVKYEMLETTLPPPKGSLLIVGRNALKDEEHRNRLKAFIRVEMTYDVRVNTSNGMRVLVFEQDLDNIWGLNTEETRWRRSFITAKGHPALEGLSDTDLEYLRGDASLVEAYPGPHAEDLGRMAIDRYPEWGNDNTVVSVAITRPQVGAFRSLLSCGFDLQESSLLEYAAGQGRIMFCQVDVHGRYGKDPVSTRLVNNIIEYMTEATEPVVSKTIDLVREGWEDSGLDIKKETIFIADRPEGPISWGVTLADLYFEGNVELPVIQGKDGAKYLYTQTEGEKAIAHVLNKRTFQTRWQIMKAMQIQAALLINQGGSADLYPNPFLQDDRETLYPIDWLEGFVHPYTMMQW